MTPTAQKDRSSVGSLEWVRDQATSQLRTATGAYPYIRSVYANRLIAEFDSYETGSTSLLEYAYTISGGELILSEGKPVTIEYVAKSASMPELTGPIVKKNAREQIAYAAVLVPGEPDSDGEVLTAEKIEAVAHKWLEDFRAIDAQHSVKSIDASPVESYILPQELKTDDYVLPAGTWVLASKIRDAAVWKQIEDGTLTGYSIMGVPASVFSETVEAVKSNGVSGAALKRTLLADLGPDWVAPFVSIVDEPAVPKAKFFALKQAAPEPKPTLIERLAGWLTEPPAGDVQPAEKAGRVLSAANLRELKAAYETLGRLLEKAEGSAEKSTEEQENTTMEEKKALQEMIAESIDAAVGKALAPLQAEIASLKEAQTPAAPAGAEEDENVDEEKEALKAKVEELEETLNAVKSRLPQADSRALKGQDDAAAADEDPFDFGDRDLLGRSRS